MKIVVINSNPKRYSVRYPKCTKDANRSFLDVKHALDFACLQNEMFEHIDREIIDYIKKTNHRVLRLKNMEFCIF